MSNTITDTLNLLNRWFDEPTDGVDRSNLLSKLALLELCGWLEVSFDDLILEADRLSIQDSDWTKNTILKQTNGFEYERHFRPMLTKLIGELDVRKIENIMENNSQGALTDLKQNLGTLWTKRCNLAHADLVQNVVAQTSFDAPSWVIGRHTVLAQLLNKYKESLVIVLSPPDTLPSLNISR